MVKVIATTVAIGTGVVVKLVVGRDYELSFRSGSHIGRARLTYRSSSDNGELNWTGTGPGNSVCNPFCGEVSIDPRKIRHISEVASDPFERFFKKGR